MSFNDVLTKIAPFSSAAQLRTVNEISNKYCDNFVSRSIELLNFKIGRV